MNWAVILAGGIGERFWPASTPERPKQLLPLVSDRSMLRETADRLNGLVPPERALVLTNATLVDAVAREVPEIPPALVIGEPRGRSTAPAIGLAAGLVAARDPEAVLLALPADHAIGDAEAFRATARAASQIAAEHSVIVLFGIVPSRPETGYGYIERGPLHALSSDAYAVERFVEKPDLETARRLWQDGRHYWNSGLFCARAGIFLAEYAVHLPLIRRAIDSAVRAWPDDPARALRDYYDAVESTSIDVGVMQPTERAVVLPASEWGWDDVGSWEALGRWVDLTMDGNVEVGDCALENCRDVIAYAQAGRIAALGVHDTVIVRTESETLVVPRSELDGLKSFVRGIGDGDLRDARR